MLATPLWVILPRLPILGFTGCGRRSHTLDPGMLAVSPIVLSDGHKGYCLRFPSHCPALSQAGTPLGGASLDRRRSILVFRDAAVPMTVMGKGWIYSCRNPSILRCLSCLGMASTSFSVPIGFAFPETEDWTIGYPTDQASAIRCSRSDNESRPG